MRQEEFYKKIDEWVSKPKDKWNHITLLAYFCKKFKEKNNYNFRLSAWKTGPGKSKESRDFAKLYNAFSKKLNDNFLPDDENESKLYVIVKIYNYINWVFDYKFRNKPVTGTGLFLIPSVINDFEAMYSRNLSRMKNNNKLNELILWAKKFAEGIFDMHQLEDVDDLKMIQNYKNSYMLPDDSCESLVIKKATEIGLI